MAISRTAGVVTSASAPAGSESRNAGTDVAVCSSATGAADAVSEVISDALPTMCMHVPRFDASPASQNAQKILDNFNLRPPYVSKRRITIRFGR